MKGLHQLPGGPLALALAALALCAPRLPADDGSWESKRGYVPAEGALYSETGNPDIVMQKEFLELRDVGLGSTRAVFQFHNDGGSAVTVECAFPIRFDFNARAVMLDGKGGLVPDAEQGVDEGGGQAAAPAGSFKAWDFGDVEPSRYAEGRTEAPEDKGFVNDLLAALSIFTDPWDATAAMAAAGDPDVYFAGTYFKDDQYPRGRKEIDAAKLLKLFGLQVQQDGRPLPVQTCVVDFGDAPGHLVLHFRHQLTFAGGSTSVVTVTYAMPTRSEVSAEPTSMRSPGIAEAFTWNYVLETASSWKDSLGRIVLAVPPGSHPGLESPWRYLGTLNGRLFYTVENWKPSSKENLSLEWRDTSADYLQFWRTVTEPLDPGDLPSVPGPAKLLGASSFLAEKADVFLPFGIWRNAPFDPARLFDGFPETAWVVRTPKGGVGEYIRFSLDTDVDRIEISNGYQRSLVNFPDKDTWSYFGKNNRVKTLDIVRDNGGLVQRIPLADTRQIQRLNISLPAGIYRAVIADIYPGSRWNDTCLGEMTFIPGTAAGFDAVSRDTFFSQYLK